MRALLTDLDGTLRDHVDGVPDVNWEALRELGRRGIQRVVATGRSLYHARRVLSEDAPIDWLIFASGAGCLRWPNGECQVQPGLASGRAEQLAAWLDGLGLSYSLHDPTPDSHRFRYRQCPQDGTDFQLRLERNREHARPLPPGELPERWLPGGVSQALVFSPPGTDWPDRLAMGAPDLRVLRSTSPIDGRSQWIELQPRETCKSRAAERLMGMLGIPPDQCRALGNDMNDLDLLEWAGQSAVVGNAVPELQARFPVVATCAAGGVAQAVGRWLA